MNFFKTDQKTPFSSAVLPSRLPVSVPGKPSIAGRVARDAVGQDTAPAFSILTRQVTGNVLGDALVGGVIGLAFGPKDSKVLATGIGAAATGLAGVVGLLGTTGYLVWANRK